MNKKNLSLVAIMSLMVMSGCWFQKNEQDAQEVEIQKLLAQEPQLQACQHSQAYAYKELTKKVFDTAAEHQELFTELGIEYLDYTKVVYPALLSMDMKKSDEYAIAPERYDVLTEQYGALVQNRALAPLSIRWLGDDKGYAVFAQEDIAAGDYIGIFTGEVVARKPYMNVDYAWSYPVKKVGDDKLIVDAKSCGNELRFVRHSFTPNCIENYVLVDNVWNVVCIACEPISKGDELVINYGKGYFATREYRHTNKYYWYFYR